MAPTCWSFVAAWTLCGVACEIKWNVNAEIKRDVSPVDNIYHRISRNHGISKQKVFACGGLHFIDLVMHT